MENPPVFFETAEIENHLKTIKNKKDLIAYLIYLREEFIKICYHLPDDDIEIYLKERNIIIKFKKLKYIELGDFYQTRITRSEYIHLLKSIDNELLPFIRRLIGKLDSSIVEDKSRIIKDYKIFNFDIKKVLNYSNELDVDKINYLKWMIAQYYNYQKKRFKSFPPAVLSDKGVSSRSDINILDFPFIKDIRCRLAVLERDPNLIIRNSYKDVCKDIKIFKRGFLFTKEKFLFEFNIFKIKEHLKSITNANERLLYLEYVYKEAAQNEDLIDDEEGSVSFIDKIHLEIKFAEKEIATLLTNEKNFNSIMKDGKPSDLIKLHWQKDNVLLPYLFELLLNEGFISQSDYEVRHKFIEQSFIKKNGKSFSSKESDQSEINYRSNSKSNKKPRNSFKANRVIEKLKSKQKKKS